MLFCKNLKKMGADIHELDDGFIINGPTPLYGSKIETFHDHRIAMAFSIAGLVADGKMILDHPECVSISYPEFYDELDRIKQWNSLQLLEILLPTVWARSFTMKFIVNWTLMLHLKKFM